MAASFRASPSLATRNISKKHIETEQEVEVREWVMSVQFGKWNVDGQPLAPDYIEKVGKALAPYGPDSNDSYSKDGITILYRGLCTTKESRRERQPYISRSGAVITWDGRLDNRVELVGELRDTVTPNSTDVDIVAAAYQRWSKNCFAKLIGDWVLSIWNPSDRSLTLAKDPIGARHIYYMLEKDNVTWCSILDPLVLFAGKRFAICEEYIAAWFAILFPPVHLTPYVGIQAVPASSYLLKRPGRCTVNTYWDFDRNKSIRYRTDSEYEEHFREVFAKSVQRRLRSDRPVLGELSGGVDSSSIICVADNIIARGLAETPRLDTASWYDDSNPNWGERPHFTKVEEMRGRAGYHIDFGAARLRGEPDSHRSFLHEFDTDHFAATPHSNGVLSEPFRQYETYIRSQGYRVSLSGIGGEEATGGFVPTPRPELQDLLARGHFVQLVRQLNAWARKMRKPRRTLLWEAVRGFLFHLPASFPQNMNPTPWLASEFVRYNRAPLSCYPSRVHLLGTLPSFQNHIQELNRVRRVLAYCGSHSARLHEKRYPYLDRDLLEFVYAIPQEQLVRVGRRRSLMKRSLAGIVPGELLNRRKQAVLRQEPDEHTFRGYPTLAEVQNCVICNSVGIVDRDRFLEALERSQCEEAFSQSLMLTLKLESWLRHLTKQGVLADRVVAKRTRYAASALSSESRDLVQPHKFSWPTDRQTTQKGGDNYEL
jgi:asparagine synthase (glutamine-hydrolysing)